MTTLTLSSLTSYRNSEDKIKDFHEKTTHSFNLLKFLGERGMKILHLLLGAYLDSKNDNCFL